MLTADGDARGMNLREARIAKESAAAVSPPDGRGVRAFRVGGKIEDVAVAPGGEDNDIGGIGLDRATYEVTCNNAARFAVDENEVEHLAAAVHLHPARGHLLLERLI